MNKALYYLAWRSLVGLIKHRMERLKQPKYLIPMLLGCFYFGMILLPQLRGGSFPPEKVAKVHQILEWALAHMLSFVAVFSILFTNLRTGMNLSETQAELLLSAPISRKELVRYVLLAAQPGLLLVTCMLGFFFGVFLKLPNVWGMLIVGYAASNFIRLVSLLVPMVEAAAKNKVVFWFFRSLPLILVVIALISRSNQLFKPDLHAEPVILMGLQIPEAYAIAIFAPAALVLKGLLGISVEAVLMAFVLLMLANFLVYSLCLTLPLNFQEFVLDYARRREAFMARQLGMKGMKGEEKERRSSLIKLNAVGPAWRAIMWKNAQWLLRSESARNMFFLVLTCFVTAIFLKFFKGGQHAVLGMAFSLPLGLASIVFLPAVLRIDFRMEMAQLEITKQFPISPRVLFFSVVGLSALVCSLITLSLFGCGLVALAVVEPTEKLFPMIMAGIVVVPSVSLSLAIMENILIMWLPAWFMVRPEEAKKGGVEFMGRAIIGFLGRIVGLTILMLVPGAAGGAVYLLGGFLGDWAIVISLWLTSILLVIEIVLIGGNAAVMYNNLDPSSVEYQ